MTDGGVQTRQFHALVAGARLAGDWFPGRIPENIEAGANTVVDSSFCFKHFFATGAVGLRVGSDVTFWRTSIAPGPHGVIEIGDRCSIGNASLVCVQRITIGADVMIAGGVTITDSDFHPVSPAGRLADTVALSPIGARANRPEIEVRPVTIADDVWIGYNATILKGVHIGAGAIIEPGAVVTRDVAPGARVAGNPAAVVEN